MNDKKTILTGDRPTGKLHLGHYIGSLENRVKMQHECNQFIMIADMQALTDNAENPQKVRDNILELGLDYLSIGLDPKINTIFIQSSVPELSDLTMFYLNLVTVARLQRNPTVKTEIAQKGFEKSLPAGFLIYPVSQAADITAFKAQLVPVGEDQLPMIEQTNEVVRRFNHTYNSNVLVECEAVRSSVGRLIGTDGKSKMSKSLNNTIYLSDSSEEVKKKVMSMMTDPNHLRVEDPGKVEGNPVFEYLTAFDKDKEGLGDLKTRYQKGGVGDVEVKKRLIEVLEEFLTPIRERRAEFEKKPEEVMNILKEGGQKARLVAQQTLKDVRKAMNINYFND
ncbi:MAG: Tryptophanyl-tRNA synthetase [Candidatus Moranbacteria bacterium GW2011_GWF2_34_56]|nr:MAG: Tryptophanyl-tRNA synthetase [Candidatus Moranbacteria bacterium GW2011_GWF1_34_10]KKP64454.1 MAG: Tryptophanyl-tRNA synthetase [Candidatus Moranbacteria bacterium GW2011_GWF2_34_56]HBI17102.1 tryptophan--tRNA ligase [Candidatus Moranbacteria bacterium]